MYTVYILECADQTFYTGITNDLEHRLRLHQSGKASKYTRSRGVRGIVYTENKRTKSSALKREVEIKQLSRIKKIQLIKQKLK